ncbi:MAG: hypothetical protein ISS35_10435 [Kiritimatiellae bacterium]|nr:hypothetical protein [Kiritimatiellia bacterium]
MTENKRTDETPNTGAAEHAHALTARTQGELVQASGEDLPVLEAFQRFLDAEREQARKRMFIMATSFSAVLVVLVAAGIYYSLSMIRPVRQDFRTLNSSVHIAEKNRERAENRLSSAIDRLHQDGRSFKETLAHDKQALAEARADIRIKTQTLEYQLTDTKTTLAELRQQNKQLQEQLAGIKNEVPALALEMETVLEKIKEHNKPQTTPSPMIKSEIITPETRPVLMPGTGPVSMTIFPAGSQEPIPWRLPIPE